MKREDYVRVSTLIQTPGAFDHIDPEVLANKCRIGTGVHEGIAAYFDNIYVGLEDDELPYYNSWKDWFEENKYEPIAYEKRYYDDDLKIQGAVDCVLEKDGKKILLDYKTSAKANPMTWSLQGEFYRRLLMKNGFENVSDTVWFLQMRKKGKAKLHELKVGDGVWKYCTAKLMSYNLDNRKELVEF